MDNLRSGVSKLVVPSIEAFREEFPKPTPIDRTDDVVGHTNHGWIAPNGQFFRCGYAEHDIFSQNLMKYWPEVVAENVSRHYGFTPYDQRNNIFIKKYKIDMPSSDYLVSQGWMKWQYRQIYHELIRTKKPISADQWLTIGWLGVHSTTDTYKEIIVDVS